MFTPLAAAIYCRISDDRAGSGLGVQRQEQDCRALVDRQGWRVAEVYVDNDVSAYRGRPRPEYLRMMEAVKAGEMGAIVAWHPDRLHRSPKELEAFIDVVEASGVAVATVQAGTLDLSTASGRMTARVVGAVARHESEQKSERQKAKARHLAEAGRVSGGGPRPYGYEADRLTVRESEAAVVRAIAARLLAGESMHSIALWMDAEGHCTTSGAVWAPTNLKKTLLAPRMAGRRQHQGRDIGPAAWPAILDEVTWRRLQAKIAIQPRGPGRRYLLTGLAFCGPCKAKLVARPNGHGTKCLVCATGVQFRGCGKIRTVVPPLDDMVCAALFDRLDGPDLARRALDVPTVDEAALLAEMAAIDAEVEAAGGRAHTEGWPPSFLTGFLQEVRVRRAEVERQIRAGAPSASGGWVGRGADLADRWDSLPIDQQRAIMAENVERIVVGPAVKGRNTFDPGRIRIAWR